jgi:hypothetical protein
MRACAGCRISLKKGGGGGKARKAQPRVNPRSWEHRCGESYGESYDESYAESYDESFAYDWYD